MSEPDWSRRLPRPLTIPTVMKLSTLADVRDLVEKQRRTCWKSAYRFAWCWRSKALSA